MAKSGSGSEGTPEDDIEADIEDDVEDRIEEELEDSVESDVEDRVEDDVEDSVEDDIEDSVEDNVEDNVEDDVEDSIEDDVEGGVEDRVDNKVSDNIDAKIEDNSGSGNARDREIEDVIDDRISSNFGDRSNASDSLGDIFDEAKALAKAEHDTVRIAADAERDAARAAAKFTRDQALAAPNADVGAIEAEYDLAKEAADEGREVAREVADGTLAITLLSISAEDEMLEDDDEESPGSGSSNSGSSDDEDHEDDSVSGSSHSGSGNGDDEGDEDEDEDNSDSRSSNSESGNSGPSRSLNDRIFSSAFDESGNEIERGEWLMLAPSGALEELSAQGFFTIEVENLDGLDLVLARIEASDGYSFNEVEAIVQGTALGAEVDYNHIYYEHHYTPGSKRIRKGRHGSAPTDLFEMPEADGGQGQSIGIIDTNVDVTHGTLKNAHIQVGDFVPYAHVRPETHGTTVASILAGDSETYQGLLPKADIYAASVFFNSPTGSELATTMSLVRALDWMTENNVPVVNMSLTGPENAILKSAIDRAYEKGTIVVAAVGNDGPTAAPLYPAAYDNVIAVTAISKKQKIYRLANRGEHVDFAAPGVNVLHALDHGEFAASSGTSIAAPFVSALISFYAYESGHISIDQLNDLAANAVDLGREGFDPIYGNGLIRPLGD